MAKQSGLHQIRGKVGEHSYYRQTGVTNGLIRSINQGMSSRVKTGEEFSNTRLNNAEFGQAGRIAHVLGMMVTPKYRPMILPFSQAKMAKSILSAIKADNAPWGQRNLPNVAGAYIGQPLIDALNLVSKNDFDSFGLVFDRNQEDDIRISPDETLFNNKLQSIGADGVRLNVAFASPFIGQYGVGFYSDEYADSHPRANFEAADLVIGDTSASFEENFPGAAPAGSPWVAVNFLIVVIMPYRIINSDIYILQEHCTFKAMIAPAS